MTNLSDAAFQIKLERFGNFMLLWGKADESCDWDLAEKYRERANQLKKELTTAYVTVRTEDDMPSKTDLPDQTCNCSNPYCQV